MLGDISRALRPAHPTSKSTDHKRWDTEIRMYAGVIRSAVHTGSGAVSRSPSYIRDSNLTKLAYEEWKKCDPLQYRGQVQSPPSVLL